MQCSSPDRVKAVAKRFLDLVNHEKYRDLNAKWTTTRASNNKLNLSFVYVSNVSSIFTT